MRQHLYYVFSVLYISSAGANLLSVVCGQVGWMAPPELMSWSDGVARQFHRSAKARPKLTLAFQQARLSRRSRMCLSCCVVHSGPRNPPQVIPSHAFSLL